MTAKTAEEQFADEMHRSIEEFGRILRPYFRRMPDENLETLLLISLSVFLGADNIYQVLQVLRPPPTTGLRMSLSATGVSSFSITFTVSRFLFCRRVFPKAELRNFSAG